MGIAFVLDSTMDLNDFVGAEETKSNDACDFVQQHHMLNAMKIAATEIAAELYEFASFKRD